MPRNTDNLSHPLSMTSHGATLIPSTITTGLYRGSKQAGIVSSHSLRILNENQSKKESLLLALDAFFKAKDDVVEVDNIPGINLFPELKESFASSANGIASSVETALGGASSGLLHLAQLPLDLSAGIQALLNTKIDSGKLIRSDASTLNAELAIDQKENGFFAHCKALSHEFSNLYDKLTKDVDARFDKGDYRVSHASVAKSSATATLGATAGVIGIFSLALDSIGAVLREMSGLAFFLKAESAASNEEKNIYHAFSACIGSFKTKDSAESLQALRALEVALSDFEAAQSWSKVHSVSSPTVSVFIRMLLSGTFIMPLRAVNSSALALTIAKDAFAHHEDLKPSAKESFSKASSLKENLDGANVHSHNVSRLCAEIDKIIGNVDGEFANFDRPRERGSILSSAKAFVGLGASLSMIPILATDIGGFFSREFSGVIDFFKHDKGTGHECADVMKTRSNQTGADLDALLARVSQLKERIERCEKLGVSAPVALGLSQIVSCGGLIATMNSVLGVGSALKELKTFSGDSRELTKLDEEEHKKADHYKLSAIESQKKSGASLGSQSASEDLSLQRKLQSVMEKVVLIHRSKLNFLQPGMERPDLNLTGKSLVASSQGNSIGFMSGALGALALVALHSGISVEVFLRALSLGSLQWKRLNDGVDKVKSCDGSQSNLSLFSNATRLSADRDSTLKPVATTTHHVAQSIASRALTVALCHSRVLTKAIDELLDEEQHFPNLPHFSESAIISAAMMDKLAGKIKQVLDKMEENQEQMPGLNQDMASQLASTSKAGIVSALSLHSLFVTPFIQSYVAMRNASKIDPLERNEALSNVSSVDRATSRGSNIFQAFTKNCINELKKLADSAPNYEYDQLNSSVQSHLSMDRSCAGSSVLLCCLTLLVDELLEISLSRSLTLLDRDKLAKTANLSKDVSSQESDILKEAIAKDSNSGEQASATHSISAYRLTVSRLGHSLVEVASQLEEKLKYEDIELDGLKIHTSQQTLMHSLALSLGHCGKTLLQFSGMISMLPLTAAGVVDDLRNFIHSNDQELRFERVHCSADSSRNGSSSRESLIIGVGTDLTTDTVLNLIKMLIRASIVGSETTISIAKILEIFSIHNRPDEALMLEAKQCSQPNGSSRNIGVDSVRSSVGINLLTASFLVESETQESNTQSTNRSIDGRQVAIDRHIDSRGVLDDEEEEKLDLKLFYKTIIRILATQESRLFQEADLDGLVQRLDKGGLALCSYHSVYGKTPNPLVVKDSFMECDDALGLLRLLIRKATLSEVGKGEGQNSLLQTLFTGLESIPKPLSHKSKGLWKDVVDQVANNLYLYDLRCQVLKPRDSNRIPFKKSEFLKFMSGAPQPQVEGPQL